MGKKAAYFSDLTGVVGDEADFAKVRIKLPGGKNVELDVLPAELSGLTMTNGEGETVTADLITAGREVAQRGRKPAAA